MWGLLFCAWLKNHSPATMDNTSSLFLSATLATLGIVCWVKNSLRSNRLLIKSGCDIKVRKLCDMKLHLKPNLISPQSLFPTSLSFFNTINSVFFLICRHYMIKRKDNVNAVFHASITEMLVLSRHRSHRTLLAHLCQKRHVRIIFISQFLFVIFCLFCDGKTKGICTIF